MKRIVIILFLFAGCISALCGREDAVLERAVNNIAKQISVFPQEKIYLHTDKPYYISGEKIFFRVFLLDALSNKQDMLSHYVYVELINSADSTAQRIKIRPDENRLFYGAIFLPEKLPQGTYTIRAYTQYMRNQGENSFFHKQVRIGNPQIPEATNQTDKNEKINNGKFDVSFYPEGGRLVSGQTSNVAFKALSANGTALDIRGEVTDSQAIQLLNLRPFTKAWEIFSSIPWRVSIIRRFAVMVNTHSGLICLRLNPMRLH